MVNVILQTLYFVLLAYVALGVFPYFSLDLLSSLGGPLTLIQFQFLSHLQGPSIEGLIRTHIVTLATLCPQVRSHLGSLRPTLAHISPFRFTQTPSSLYKLTQVTQTLFNLSRPIQVHFNSFQAHRLGPFEHIQAHLDTLDPLGPSQFLPSQPRSPFRHVLQGSYGFHGSHGSYDLFCMPCMTCFWYGCLTIFLIIIVIIIIFYNAFFSYSCSQFNNLMKFSHLI